MHTLIVAVEPVDWYLGQGLAVRLRDVEDVDDAESANHLDRRVFIFELGAVLAGPAPEGSPGLERMTPGSPCGRRQPAPAR